MAAPGLASGSFSVAPHAGRDVGSAFYLSDGGLTSLTFGDYVPRTPLYRAMLDFETVVGTGTFTLAITYVLSTLDALRAEAQRASGVEDTASEDCVYERFSEWLPFHRRSSTFVDALGAFLGYDARKYDARKEDARRDDARK